MKKSQKVAQILGGKETKFIKTLSKALENSVEIDINHCMIWLQINAGATQEQSDEIVRLFL